MSILNQMASNTFPTASELPIAISTLEAPLDWKLQWSWNGPAWIWLAALVTIAAWIVIWYLRQPCIAGRNVRKVLIALRLATVGLVCLLLIRPTFHRWHTGKPHLALLVDQSASMELVNTRRPGNPADASGAGGSSQDNQLPPPLTRLQQTIRLLTDGDPSLLDQLQSSFAVDVVLLDNAFALLEPSGDLRVTDQLQALLKRSSMSTSDPFQKHADQDVDKRHWPTTGLADEDQQTNHRAATRLGDAVDYALRRMPGPGPTAIILLSDGISTRGESLSTVARRARDHGVPLYTVAVGEGDNRPDIRVAHLIAEDAMLMDDLLTVDAIIQTRGVAGRSIEATLYDKGEDRQVAHTTVRVPSDTQENQSVPASTTDQSVRLFYRPTTAGKHDLELRIRLGSNGLQSNERLRENPSIEHRTAHQVVVHGQPVRVLLAQTSPSFEYRALRSILHRDPSITLRTHLGRAGPDFAQTDPTALSTFPLSLQELADYDVIILGDIDAKWLPQAVWSSLLEFVSGQAGGLILIAGPRYLPGTFWGNRSMEVLMPIVPSGIGPLMTDQDDILNWAAGQFSGIRQITGGTQFPNHSFFIQPTPDGQNDPSMLLADSPEASEAQWQAMHPVTWLVGGEGPTDKRDGPVQVKRGARVLANAIQSPDGQTLPVIVRHYVGAGEVLMHLTDETWRLRFRSDDRAFARYWGQAVRRLARGRLSGAKAGFEIATDAANYHPGEYIFVQARFRNPAQSPAKDRLTLTMEANSGPNRPITLQRLPGHRSQFATTLYGLRPGQYELRLSEQVELSGRQSFTSTTARFTILQPPGELTRRNADIHSLAQAAKITHGKSYTLSDASELPADLPAVKVIPVRQLPPVELARYHFVIGLLCGLLAIEWLLRRWCGML